MDNIDLTPLEARILLSIDHVGWFSYLWFPIVQREVLNFGDDHSDEHVHRGIVGLIRTGALILTPADGDELGLGVPEWQPEVNALANAIKWERLTNERAGLT